MPWQDAEGPPSTLAVHRWYPNNIPPSTVTLNDQVTWPPTLPFARIVQITGWRSAPEQEDNRDPRTYGDGELTYPSRKLGKTLVYECRVEAATVQSCEGLMSIILNGFADTSNEGRMDVHPYAAFGGPSVDWQYRARVISFDADPTWVWDSQRRAHFQWGFSLSLRMSDPHFYYLGTPYL